MLMSIISIIANVLYMVVLNLTLYTDRAPMPNGETREWHRSPVSRLNISDQGWLYSLQIVLAAISIISSILVMVGVKASIVKTVQLVSTIASTVLFIIIMIVTSNTHVNYS